MPAPIVPKPPWLTTPDVDEADVPKPSPNRVEVGTEAARTLRGWAPPGSTVEAVNLSAIPDQRIFSDETSAIAVADEKGNYSGGRLPSEQSLYEGDWVRLRARLPDGSTTPWHNHRVMGIAGEDERRPVVALFRIGVQATSDGRVLLSNINPGRPISEPSAQLRFTNQRTGERLTVTLDGLGTFPERSALNGLPGDTFSVAATDGVYDTALETIIGRVAVPKFTQDAPGDVKDPPMGTKDRTEDGSPMYAKKLFKGPLFRDGVQQEDVLQGNLPNCTFPAVVASLAHFQPELIKKLIVDNHDGTYTVTFHVKDPATGKFRPQKVTVDGDLYVRFGVDEPVYGAAGTGSRAPAEMELWYALLEKAYAQFRGGYQAFEDTTAENAETMLQALTGLPTWQLPNVDSATVWETIRAAVDEERPMIGYTTTGPKYFNTGLITDHGYSVLGYTERDGRRFVKLSNPWRTSAPFGFAGESKNGTFEYPFEKFMELFGGVVYAQRAYSS